MDKFANYKVMIVDLEEELHVRQGYDKVEVTVVDGRVYTGRLHKISAKEFQLQTSEEIVVISASDVVEFSIVEEE